MAAPENRQAQYVSKSAKRGRFWRAVSKIYGLMCCQTSQLAEPQMWRQRERARWKALLFQEVGKYIGTNWSWGTKESWT